MTTNPWPDLLDHYIPTVRQNQKTDKNDALAIIQASQLADIGFINAKLISNNNYKPC